MVMNKKGNWLLWGIFALLVIALIFVGAHFLNLSILNAPNDQGGIFVNQQGETQFNEGDVLTVTGGVTVDQGENKPVGSAIWIDDKLCRVDTTNLCNFYPDRGCQTFLDQAAFDSLQLGSTQQIMPTCILPSGYHTVKAVSARVLRVGDGQFINRGPDDVYWTIQKTIYVIPNTATTTTTLPGTVPSTTLNQGTTTTTLPNGGGTTGSSAGIFTRFINWFTSLFKGFSWT